MVGLGDCFGDGEEGCLFAGVEGLQIYSKG